MIADAVKLKHQITTTNTVIITTVADTTKVFAADNQPHRERANHQYLWGHC